MQILAKGDTSQEKMVPSDSWPMRHGVPSTSKSPNSATSLNHHMKRVSIREHIDKELDNLDTHLPNLDFNKLEEKLNCAAEERIMTERKLLGEQVILFAYSIRHERCAHILHA